MGYHIILDPGEFSIRQVYVEHFADLVKVDGLTRDSIIYEGSTEEVAERVGNSLRYGNLGEPWYRAGVRAQQTFARMAKRRGWVLEEIAQDLESFQAYASVIRKPVKRGDFLIRNLYNLEIEVKCRTFYGEGTKRFFYFSAEDLEKHLNMQCSTRVPVVVALYRRKDDRPVSGSLCMIGMDRIRELTRGLTTERREYGEAYRIPLNETVQGFEWLKEYEKARDIGSNRMEEERTGAYRKREKSLQDETYVLVGYCKSPEHLQWVMERGLYNMRMGNDRGALRLGIQEAGAKYILLHTQREKITGNLFRILDAGPSIFSREDLIKRGYPGGPAHDFYLVYRICPVADKKLAGRVWDIRNFEGYRSGHGIAFTFAIRWSDFIKMK